MQSIPSHSTRTTRHGVSLIELLVALSILLAGLLAMAASFPLIMRSQRDAELLVVGAALAQRKAEEIRLMDSGRRRSARRDLGSHRTHRADRLHE